MKSPLIAATCALLGGCGDHASMHDAATSPWSEGAAVPKPRLEPGVSALGSRVVVLGGFDTDLTSGLEITTRVDAYDTGADAWSQLPDAPVAWTHVQLAGVGTSLYLLGGLEGTMYVAHGEAWKLDTLDPGGHWQPIMALPAGQERGSAAVVVAPSMVAPGHVYLIGGASTTNALATVLDYDTIANSWSQLPALPAPRSHPAAMIRGDGTLVVAGGLGGLFADSAAADTWILPLGATAWQAVTPMPTARGGCAYGKLQEQLVCAGGEAQLSALANVESYDPTSDTWTVDSPMPKPTAGTQGAVVGARLFVPGGARALVFDPTDTLFIYAPLVSGP
jgi:N-acetylneuraminic acid mutarotase